MEDVGPISELSLVKLRAIIESWGKGEISTEQLQVWMIDHYDPSEIKVGLSEAEHTQEAMHLVMNEYELAESEKIIEEKWHLAISLLECNQENFLERRKLFLSTAFRD